MMTQTLPSGFLRVPEGSFIGGERSGQRIDAFAMKATPVTNHEWATVPDGLGSEPYVQLFHDWNTGGTRFEKFVERPDFSLLQQLDSSPAVVNDPGEGNDIDRLGVWIYGSAILVKIIRDPSALFNRVELDGGYYGGPEKSPVSIFFNGQQQPVIGGSYFHYKAWCLLKSQLSNGVFTYDLPTDEQYDYVASDRGTKRFGTETGDEKRGDKKLIHAAEIPNDGRMTAEVDAPDYEQNFPFGIQTAGNVWRRIRFNPNFIESKEPLLEPYGMRGGSWKTDIKFAAAVFRGSLSPEVYENDIGFSPVVEFSGQTTAP